MILCCSCFFPFNPASRSFFYTFSYTTLFRSQDADMVVLIHREDLYEKESPRAGEADLIIAKHRNGPTATIARSEEHTSELQSRGHLVCRLLLEKKNLIRSMIELKHFIITTAH